MKKSDRIKLIKKILVDNEIMTQDDLVTSLLNLDIEVTQATVSRDMRELKLIKAPAKNGGYRYALPEMYQSNASDNTVKSLIEDIKLLEKQISIRTSPGSAMILKKRLLALFEPLLFTVLSDDDTILLIALTDESAQTIFERLVS